MALTCCVKNCSNSAYWLNKWKTQLCDACGCLRKEKMCNCPPPFRLFTFPTKKKRPLDREKWKQLVGRSVGNKLWSPPKDSRICSSHFEDGEPTLGNPLPTMNMGYEGASGRVRRMALYEATRPALVGRKKKLTVDVQPIPHDICPLIPENIKPNDPEEEFLTPELPKLPWFINILLLVTTLLLNLLDKEKKIKKLSEENQRLRESICQLKSTVYTEKILKTDADVNFHTGLEKKSIFVKLHNKIAPFVNRRWTGAKSVLKHLKTCKTFKRFGPDRKMNSKSEFLLMLMKLRLGLLNKDLAKRFDISETLVSRIFFAWLRASCVILKSLLYIPTQEELIGSEPERFRKFPDLHSIIDCTELFIETPKDLALQSASWSDYKHHNTLKVLVACAPNSAIIFISPAYLGRTSDKALTVDSGFLDIIPFNSMIMADKGFNICNECEQRNIRLYIPPGKRGHSQMTSSNVQKTKQIANHRILIEQVIRRLKTFRILANELPISLVGHVDEMLNVCAALCNLKEPIYKV